MKSHIIPFISFLALAPTAYASNIEDTWEGPVKLDLNAYVFAADLQGTLSKGDTDYTVDQPFSESAKNLDRFYMFELDLNKGRWGTYLDMEVVKISENKDVLNYPVAVTTDLNQGKFGVYYQAYISEKNEKNNLPRFIVEPTIGMHRTEVEADLSAFGKKITVSENWNEFFWGSRFKYNFDSPWNLSGEAIFGAEDTISTQAHLGYRKDIFKRPINFKVGYHYFKQNHRIDDFKLDIKEHGPVIGINIPIF